MAKSAFVIKPDSKQIQVTSWLKGLKERPPYLTKSARYQLRKAQRQAAR
jgi:hypothetical protein